MSSHTQHILCCCLTHSTTAAVTFLEPVEAASVHSPAQDKKSHIALLTATVFLLLQGRLPIRVELRGLTASDFERILTEPECNMIYQQQVRQ